MIRKIKKYGWTPDLPDERDMPFRAAPHMLANLPPKVDLRPGCPAVYDQGELGSCTANAIGAAYQFEQIKQDPEKDFTPSRLFIYINERIMEGSINQDNGAMIRDGIKSVADQGVCPEIEWPYDISKFAAIPPAECYTHAMEHQVTSYMRITPVLSEMKGCLAAGYPFVFGFTVYENFESQDVAKTGIMHMPKGSAVGGHAVCAVGYDDTTKCVIVRNSWGAGWGAGGYFFMPYAYISNTNLADDFWTIRTVEL